jgi:hypothetical protein
MTFNNFYAAYRQHDGEQPQRKPRKYDGYELHFINGDTYIYDEQLKPGRIPSSWSGCYGMDDFTTRATWNGDLIEYPQEVTA